jgi:hypothetical protein
MVHGNGMVHYTIVRPRGKPFYSFLELQATTTIYPLILIAACTFPITPLVEMNKLTISLKSHLLKTSITAMNHTRSPLPTPNSYPQNRSRETSRRTLHRRSLQNHGHREEKEAKIRRIHYRRGLEQAGLEAGTRKQITRAELRRGTHLSGSGFGGGGREGRGARRAERISMGQGLVSSPSMATHPPAPANVVGVAAGRWEGGEPPDL